MKEQKFFIPLYVTYNEYLALLWALQFAAKQGGYDERPQKQTVDKIAAYEKRFEKQDKKQDKAWHDYLKHKRQLQRANAAGSQPTKED